VRPFPASSGEVRMKYIAKTESVKLPHASSKHPRGTKTPPATQHKLDRNDRQRGKNECLSRHTDEPSQDLARGNRRASSVLRVQNRCRKSVSAPPLPSRKKGPRMARCDLAANNPTRPAPTIASPMLPVRRPFMLNPSRMC
jgi:hypothetical protein